MTSSRPSVSLPHKNRNHWGFITFLVATLLLCARSLPAQNAPHAPGWVVITISDYRTLHAKAYPPEREPEGPPVDATLTRVDYDLHIDGDLAAGRASLTVDVLKDGWVRVPIPPGLLVREAKLDGKLVSLVPGAPGKARTNSPLSFRDPGAPYCNSISRCPSFPLQAKKVFLCLPPLPVLRAPQFAFRARGWTSG